MKKGLITLSILLMTVLLFTGLAAAMDSTNFAINWDVIGGSEGGAVTSASYSVDGTVGQAVTGFSSSSSYQAGSGYWYGEAPPAGSLVYLPMIVK